MADINSNEKLTDINSILITAMQAGASDVHITTGIPPKMRINGKLFTVTGYEGTRLLPPDTRQIADSVMNDRQKELLEKNGQHDMAYSIPRVGRFRVNLFKQRGSVALAFRLVATSVPSAKELGIPQSVEDLYMKQRGLVLVTGPTGSGKSTTLASIIDHINHSRDAHVITLEDPIEFLYSHDRSIVNQREIGLDSNDYASALRAALREDPDVIMVGEMRDRETISTALTAAETGHLVLSTLHTIGAASTIDRIIDVFEPHQQQQIRQQLATVLESIISQQLIPRADGNSRVCAFEVMHINPALRSVIREGKAERINTFIQSGGKEHMILMDDAILELLQKGEITEEMARQYAQDAAYIDRKRGMQGGQWY